MSTVEIPSRDTRGPLPGLQTCRLVLYVLPFILIIFAVLDYGIKKAWMSTHHSTQKEVHHNSCFMVWSAGAAAYWEQAEGLLWDALLTQWW